MIILTVLYAIGYVFISFFLFTQFGLWVDMVGPLGIIVFGFSGIVTFRYVTEEREKLWIKSAFSRYLSKEVITKLMEDPSKLKLGGERRNLTILFADVRGFTKFSESHQPEEVVTVLNECLSEMVNVVLKYNGTLDKFVGDQIMAFFGAPGDTHEYDHPLFTIQTALEMQERLKELQNEWLKQRKEPLKIGIGINTGDVVVGNMGSLKRMDYTVIGDNVNLAARLCSAAEGDEILISEVTYNQVHTMIEAEELGPITVKGKSQPVCVYKVKRLR